MAVDSWAEFKLTGDPILVVGLREAGVIKGYRAIIDVDLHPALVEVAENALAKVEKMDAVTYTPYVSPGEGEYLSLDPATLTIPIDEEIANVDIGSAAAGESGGGEAKGPPTQKEQTARLQWIIEHADTLPTIGAKELIERIDDLYFQAVCMHCSPPVIGFVTKTNARKTLRRSAIPLGRDSSDRFKRITRPELILEGEAHAIMAPGEIAILNKPQFQFMVGDIGLVTRYVPSQMGRISALLTRHKMPLSSATQSAIEAKATDSIQLAKRLDAFAARIERIDVARMTSGTGFSDQDLKKADFVNASGELDCEPDRVTELIDALEGRFFSDAFTGNPQRADHFRPRS
jgi:hypothetical protein